MDYETVNIFIPIVYYITLIVSLLLLGFTFYKINKPGDERGELIRNKTVLSTFTILMFILVASIAYTVVQDIQQLRIEPIIILVLSSFIFWLNYLYYRRKYS